MNFVEFRFLVFFGVVFGLHWLLRGASARKNLLLAASYLFYGAWDVRFLGLIALSTIVDFSVGRRLAVTEGPGARKLLLTVSLVLNLGLLGLYKYFDFFIESGAAMLAWAGLETSPESLGLILPVGISFYTFQTLSYTIDVYRRKLESESSLRDFALFVAFFPQLVAGPIVRAREFLPQLSRPRVFETVQFRAALTLFLFGFVKKACVADNCAPFVDEIYSNPELYTAGMHWLGIGLYYVQIYCDFSGYSDMAIATAAMLGYQLPLNFDFPIFARSVTEYWRRWHISLASWFRDYVYISLGGNRHGPVRTYLALLTVFFLCALWHGAAWNFVVWGMLHGLMLLLERRLDIAPWLERRFIGLVWANLVFTVALVFFRASSFELPWQFVQTMFGLRADGSEMLDEWHIGAAIGLVFLAFHALNKAVRVDHWMERLPKPVFAVTLGVAAAIALPCVAANYAPFIYFQF